MTWRTCVLLMMLWPFAHASAEEVCPWLTQGTAAALTGEDVSAKVHVSAGVGTCEFVSRVRGDQAGTAQDTRLRMVISVSNLPSKECATGQKLTGIGQDAVVCKTDFEGEHREIINGRVRATFFSLTLTVKEASGRKNFLLSRLLEQAAEEVAGNLF